MPKPRRTPAAHSAFAALPVRMVTLGSGAEQLAVHVAGRLASDRPPLLCVPGYTRNMADFTEFVPLVQQLIGSDWPVVLVDLRGRGRSTDRARAADYTTTNDARDLSMLVRALGIERVMLIGQGHGGQVAMALAAERPGLLAAAVLIDAGPVAAPQSLIRLRSNAHTVAGARGGSGLTIMLRRMTAAEYPELELEHLERLTQRTHFVDDKGRAAALYDGALIERLQGFGHDDVLVPQWPLFNLLARVPLMFLRTELTDQLPREVLEEMMQRRPDALSLAITRQGSPALLDHADEVGAIADFVRRLMRLNERGAKRA